MRTIAVRVSVLVFLFAVAFPGSARAEDVVLADGTIRQGEILAVEADGVRIKWSPPGGGEVTMKVPARKLDPHYFYNLRDKAAGDDAKARIELALWAVDANMFNLAKVQVRKAAALDPKLVKDIQEGKLPEIREGIARHVLASAEADMKAGRLDVAEEKLEALLTRMPDTEAGTQAIDVMAALQAQIGEQEVKVAAEEQARLDEAARKAVEERAKLMDPAEKDLKEGKKLALEGLSEDSDTKALGLLEQALSRGEAALKKFEKLSKDHAGDAELMAKVQERSAWATQGMVKIRLHRADIYMWRDSLNQAKDEIDAARLLSPESEAVAAASDRVYEAQMDDDWDIRWQRARREGVGRFSGARGGRGGGGARR